MLHLTSVEIESIYRLRYSVYVKELNYCQLTADSKLGMLKDTLDVTGNLFGMFKDGDAIGTISTNYAKNSNLGYYYDLYKMKEFSLGSYDDYSITTKLIIREDFRLKGIGLRLALAAYTQGVADNIKYDFIDCAKEMVPFYLRLGYKVYRDNILHPDFGHGKALVLILRDAEYFKKYASRLIARRGSVYEVKMKFREG